MARLVCEKNIRKRTSRVTMLDMGSPFLSSIVKYNDWTYVIGCKERKVNVRFLMILTSSFG